MREQRGVNAKLSLKKTGLSCMNNVFVNVFPVITVKRRKTWGSINKTWGSINKTWGSINKTWGPINMINDKKGRGIESFIIIFVVLCL